MKTGGKKSHSDMDLMLYADGELSADEAREVAEWLAEDAAARLKLESLRGVGEAVRTYTELETDRAEVEVPAFADMWQRIERRIRANGRSEPVPAGAPADAASASGGRPRAAAGSERGPVVGLWATLRRWYEEHRGHVFTGAISAGVACALMLWLRPHPQDVQSQARRRGGAVAQPVVMRSQPPEVENLEVYEGSGTILTIEPDGDDDSAAAVIWISSNEDQNRGGPL